MSLLVRRTRLVAVTSAAPDEPVDVRVRDGVVTDVRPSLGTEQGERVVDADGRWLVPGLWDAHVHFSQWSRTLTQLDVSGTSGPEQVVDRVATAVAARGRSSDAVLGYGYRSGAWSRQPTVAELDDVAGLRPVALVSGDAHNGWLSSAALRLLGLPARTGPLEEAEWFAVLPRLGELPTAHDPMAAVRTAAGQAAALGVVGIGDMEWEPGFLRWPERIAAGVTQLRVRTAVYEPDLDGVLAAGLRTGDLLDSAGLVEMGPLKVIFDGSVNTRTAWCCEPYAGAAGRWRGTLNISPERLVELAAQATATGLEVALHAIGDAAVSAALDAFERSGACGSIEHVQLVAPDDVPRFAALGVRASVQPAHLLDDRDLSVALWPHAQERCFALRSLLDAGAALALGSDAPVARLDPWLAMAAAVHRSADDRSPWTPHEALTPREALAASVDGAGTVAAGSRADLALLDHDPLAPEPDSESAAARLTSVRVAATVVDGGLTFEA